MANNNGSTGWKDPYEEQLKSYLQQMESREPFQYDINKDALYQQLKDNYEQQGKLAMEDTIGKAASMTGGYGNSYAQTAGQQAYYQNLKQLNSMVPTLSEMAHDRYQQEGQELQDKYDFYKGLSDESYNKYLLENGLVAGDATYKSIDVGGETYNYMCNKISDVQTVEQLIALKDEYIALGYDPRQVNALTKAKYDELKPQATRQPIIKPDGGGWAVGLK